MRWGLFLLWGALAPVARADEPRSARPQVSFNEIYSIQMSELANGRCQVEVLQDNAPSWTLDECVGAPDDLLFISNDGDHFWVIRTLPELQAATRKKKDRAGPVVVATRMDRHG